MEESQIRDVAEQLARRRGIDACPGGGCALAGLNAFVAAGRVSRDAEVVLFNTGTSPLSR